MKGRNGVRHHRRAPTIARGLDRQLAGRGDGGSHRVEHLGQLFVQIGDDDRAVWLDQDLGFNP
ncbi:MAG: hypothetical protein OZSIB_1366 [Candidatus Ozemobacter sibiricus]|uniref:Uncharacterized protein n=1 Tax=Candidatus Ozemobacter sibiricus TaxID=2268124 RepID=A0A367ZK21_9BACT|nr:MAG: hypothetical protein OZSIB_1366 [Candidatus Ozemobacter sibiricus]